MPPRRRLVTHIATATPALNREPQCRYHEYIVAGTAPRISSFNPPPPTPCARQQERACRQFSAAARSVRPRSVFSPSLLFFSSLYTGLPWDAVRALDIRPWYTHTRIRRGICRPVATYVVLIHVRRSHLPFHAFPSHLIRPPAVYPVFMHCIPSRSLR